MRDSLLCDVLCHADDGDGRFVEAVEDGVGRVHIALLYGCAVDVFCGEVEVLVEVNFHCRRCEYYCA